MTKRVRIIPYQVPVWSRSLCRWECGTLLSSKILGQVGSVQGHSSKLQTLFLISIGIWLKSICKVHQGQPGEGTARSKVACTCRGKGLEGGKRGKPMCVWPAGPQIIILNTSSSTNAPCPTPWGDFLKSD